MEGVSSLSIMIAGLDDKGKASPFFRERERKSKREDVGSDMNVNLPFISFKKAIVEPYFVKISLLEHFCTTFSHTHFK